MPRACACVCGVHMHRINNERRSETAALIPVINIRYAKYVIDEGITQHCVRCRGCITLELEWHVCPRYDEIALEVYFNDNFLQMALTFLIWIKTNFGQIGPYQFRSTTMLRHHFLQIITVIIIERIKVH